MAKEDTEALKALPAQSREYVQKILKEHPSYYDEGWAATYLPHFIKFEQKFLSGDHSFFPRYEVMGGITYLMSLAEIKNFTEAKLKEMYKAGKIITQADFEKLPQDKWLDRGKNLTRIWGAHYLDKKFRENKMDAHRVPSYIIVADDLKNLRIKLWFSDCFPIINVIENGTIYAEKITGEPWARRAARMGFGYTDYSDAGNILKTADSKYYFVDTENKSFYDGHPAKEIVIKGNPINSRMCEYFKRRFELLHNLPKDSVAEDISISLMDGTSASVERLGSEERAVAAAAAVKL